MAIEQREPKLNGTEVFTNGAETPSFVENIPTVDRAENGQSSLERSSNEDTLSGSLRKSELDGKIGYDSNEIKNKVLSSISPTQAESWSTLIVSKVQGEEIKSL